MCMISSDSASLNPCMPLLPGQPGSAHCRLVSEPLTDTWWELSGPSSHPGGSYCLSHTEHLPLLMPVSQLSLAPVATPFQIPLKRVTAQALVAHFYDIQHV